MRPSALVLAILMAGHLLGTTSASCLAEAERASTPGNYVYELLPIPQLGTSARVAFHPDGSYALILQNHDVLHVVDWNSKTTTSYDFSAEPGTLYWADMSFESDGSGAYLVGWHYESSLSTGTVWRLDDTALRSGGTQSEIFTELTAARRADQQFMAIEFPGPSGLPVVLGRSSLAFIITLYELNPATTNLEFLSSNNSDADCTDLAFVDNEFGSPGILVVGGGVGRDALYYTEVGGFWEWRTDLGNNLTGNLSRVDAHISHNYGLAVDFVGRRLYRFESGQMNATGDAPDFPVNGIWDVAFNSEGSTALIVGRAGISPSRGTVFEYRHDEYSAAAITEVSVPGFDSPPYNATSNTYLFASAFRPGCDGGIMVGGDQGASTGLVVLFQNTLGTSCEVGTSSGPARRPTPRLRANHPNPFNPNTSIGFWLPQPARAVLAIYDLSGRLVRTLVSDDRPSGEHVTYWDGKDAAGDQVASGVYLYRLEVGDYAEIKRMVLLK